MGIVETLIAVLKLLTTLLELVKACKEMSVRLRTHKRRRRSRKRRRRLNYAALCCDGAQAGRFLGQQGTQIDAQRKQKAVQFREQVGSG